MDERIFGEVNNKCNKFIQTFRTCLQINDFYISDMQRLHLLLDELLLSYTVVGIMVSNRGTVRKGSEYVDLEDS